MASASTKAGLLQAVVPWDVAVVALIVISGLPRASLPFFSRGIFAQWVKCDELTFGRIPP